MPLLPAKLIPCPQKDAYNICRIREFTVAMYSITKIELES